MAAHDLQRLCGIEFNKLTIKLQQGLKQDIARYVFNLTDKYSIFSFFVFFFVILYHLKYHLSFILF